MRIAHARMSWAVVASLVAGPVVVAPSRADAELSKGLSLEEIRGVMRANAVAFNACLTGATRGHKELHGPFLYQIEVDKRGNVSSAHPYAPSAVAAFDTCVVAVLKRAKFPGGPAHVETPLVFDAE
ncbi:MAG: hypothetical protein ABIY55_18635 [Kofleriaceae bacterium]